MTLPLEKLRRVIEAAVITATEPVSLDRMAQLFPEDERPSNAELRTVLQTLEEDYRSRGVELKKVASGYRFQVQQDVASYLSTWIEEPPSRYSRALLETLALIAYKQPITRAEIEEVRGVAVSSNILRTLQERDWIKIVGHKDVPGKPGLYATTPQFLNDLSLQNLSQLPMLMETQEEQGAAQLALELEQQQIEQQENVEAQQEETADPLAAEEMLEELIMSPQEEEADLLLEAEQAHEELEVEELEVVE